MWWLIIIPVVIFSSVLSLVLVKPSKYNKNVDDMEQDEAKFRYYIPYFHSQGAGYSIMDMTKEIKTIDDLYGIISDIERLNDAKRVIPINWVRL